MEGRDGKPGASSTPRRFHHTDNPEKEKEHEEDTVQRRAAQGCARAWAALLKALWKAAGPFIAGALGGFAAGCTFAGIGPNFL